MSTDDDLIRGTRNILQNMVKTISQLKEDMRSHIEQEAANILRIEALNFKLLEAKQQDKNIKTNIAVLRQSIDQLEQVEQNLRCTLSPMKHLPNEVLLHIFRIIVEKADRSRRKRAEYRRWGTLNERSLPLRLGHVCRRWRVLVTANLFLWTTVEARLQEELKVEQEWMTHWTRAQRTNDQTLFIYGWSNKRHDMLCELLDALPAKWKAVSISVGSEATGSWDVNMMYADEVTIRGYSLVSTAYFTPLMRRALSLTIYGPSPEWGVLPWIHLRSLIIKELTSPAETLASPLRFG
jgi:F-box-like